MYIWALLLAFVVTLVLGNLHLHFALQSPAIKELIATFTIVTKKASSIIMAIVM